MFRNNVIVEAHAIIIVKNKIMNLFSNRDLNIQTSKDNGELTILPLPL
jgi:hypothetical protein